MKGNPGALAHLSWLLLVGALGTLLFTFGDRDDYAHVALLENAAAESEDATTVFELTLAEARVVRQVVCFNYEGSREEFLDALGTLKLRWIDVHGEPVVSEALADAGQAPQYDDGRRCAELAGVPLVGGDYRLELIGEGSDLDTSQVGVLVLESTPMQLPERLAVLVLLLAMFLKLLAWNYRQPPSEKKERRRWAPWDPMLGVGLVIAGSIVVALFLGGNPMTSVKQFRETGGLDAEVLGTSDLGVSTWTMLILMLTTAAVYLAGARGMARLRHKDTNELLHTHSPRRIHVAVSVAMGVSMAIGASILLSLWTPDESSRMQLQTLVPALTLATAVVAALAPWYEELFFRGFLFSSIAELTTGAVAVVVVTALFTLAHLGQHMGFLVPLIPIFGVALATSLLRWFSGSTTAAFGLHLGYNATLVLPILLTGV